MWVRVTCAVWRCVFSPMSIVLSATTLAASQTWVLVMKFPVAIVSAMLCAAALSFLVSGAIAETLNAQSVIQRYLDAINREDVPAALAMLADDATYTILPAAIATGHSNFDGKDEIRRVMQAALALHSRVQSVGTVQVSGNTVRLRLRESADNFSKLGIDALEDDAVYVVRDGKIQAGVHVYAPESMMRLAAARAAAVIRGYIAAANAGDVDAALSYWAEDAIYTVLPAAFTGQSEFVGKAQIRALVEAFAAQHSRSEIDEPLAVDGERVSGRFQSAIDSFRELGIDSLDSMAEAIVRDGKIQSATYRFTPESIARLAAARAAVADTPEGESGQP